MDEFNRIKISVLGALGSIFQDIFNGLKSLEDETSNLLYQRFKFRFENEFIQIRKTGMYIMTMNPGYAGRSELP